MKRVLEPELMIDIDQVKAYAKANFKDSDQRFCKFIFDQLSSLENIENKGDKLTILDLGSGPGNISYELFNFFKNIQVLGLDGSREMLEIAKARKVDFPFKKYIEFHEALIPFNTIEIEKISKYFYNETIDIIVSNSLLHHIHNPNDFWQTMIQLKPRHIFISDLIRPKSSIIAQKIVEEYAKDEDQILKNDFYNSLLAAFSIGEIKQQISFYKIDKKSKLITPTDRHFMLHINM